MAITQVELDDDTLRTKAAAGCAEALQALLERHAATAVRSAHAILGNRDDALDVAQETLLRLATEIRAPWRGGSYRAYVAIVAQRIALNCRKGEQVRKRREDVIGMSATTAAPGPDAAAELAESLAALRGEVAGLPELSANVLLLHYIHHLSVAEIARQTGLSVDACKQRLARGRDELGERLRRRGIALACLALLAGLSSAADACAGEAAGQSVAMAARASSRMQPVRSNKIPRSQPGKLANPAYPVIVSTVLMLVLGSYMAREICARAQPAVSNTHTVSAPNNHIAQENSNMNRKFGQYARAALIATAAATAAQGQEAPPPAPQPQAQMGNPPQVWMPWGAQASLSAPLIELQQSAATISGDGEVRINVDKVADALKSMPAESLANIPGDDLTAKAKHLLENPSIPKRVQYAPVSVSVNFALNASGLPVPDEAPMKSAMPPSLPTPGIAADAEPGVVAYQSVTKLKCDAKPGVVAYQSLTMLKRDSPVDNAFQRVMSWLTPHANVQTWVEADAQTMKALAAAGSDAMQSTNRVAINMSMATPPQVESIQVDTLPVFTLPDTFYKTVAKSGKLPETKTADGQKPATPVAANPPLVLFKSEIPKPLQALVRPVFDKFTNGLNLNFDDKRVFEAPDRVEGKDYIFKADDEKKDAAAPETAPQKPPAPPDKSEF